jgi:Ca2+-binding EF-hand superfamily protein
MTFGSLILSSKDEELLSILEDLDTGDGFIHFEEFIKFMTSRTQIRDTFDEVVSSWKDLSNGKVFACNPPSWS